MVTTAATHYSNYCSHSSQSFFIIVPPESQRNRFKSSLVYMLRNSPAFLTSPTSTHPVLFFLPLRSSASLRRAWCTSRYGTNAL